MPVNLLLNRQVRVWDRSSELVGVGEVGLRIILREIVRQILINSAVKFSHYSLVATYGQPLRLWLTVSTICKSGNYVRNFRFINQFINRDVIEGSRRPEILSVGASVRWSLVGVGA